ncbi:D-alanine--poly(phosphoribitol) ligase subunit DltC [Isobaculum melis]|uniref:D-alanyl carrier protein n=1 Tax=Isobaculum melis TaxID=142588 RepID=A0A1H9T811_9LACT|nr:D-alanine--poly(phosphoribitol) ligase subunit DltC [Isobaculum melis]SER93410.1 D-alanine--poly(phosphoribitol) ligase subunit 2 [Isobaculum melis]
MVDKNEFLTILAEITGEDEVKEDLDFPLYDSGVLDSLGTVQLLVEIEAQMGIQVPVSDFDRDEWATPNKMLEQLEQLK